MTNNDLIKYNIKNTDNYETKHIVTIDLDNPTSEKVKNELKKASNTIYLMLKNIIFLLKSFLFLF